MRENTTANAPRMRTAKEVVSRPARHILLVAVPPVRTLDVYGPVEVFDDANRLHGGVPVYKIDVVSAVEDRQVTSHTELPLLAKVFSNRKMMLWAGFWAESE